MPVIADNFDKSLYRGYGYIRNCVSPDIVLFLPDLFLIMLIHQEQFNVHWHGCTRGIYNGHGHFKYKDSDNMSDIVFPHPQIYIKRWFFPFPYCMEKMVYVLEGQQPGGSIVVYLSEPINNNNKII